jgi:hypothetical protein
MAEANLNYQTIRTTHAVREAVGEFKKNNDRISCCFRMIKESKIGKRI